MTVSYRRSSAGSRQILQSPPVASAVHGLAEQVAAATRTQQPEADVVVDDYTTDRAASAVTIRDPQARLWQVRDVILTRAAASVGLEVRDRLVTTRSSRTTRRS